MILDAAMRSLFNDLMVDIFQEPVVERTCGEEEEGFSSPSRYPFAFADLDFSAKYG